jgi:predicted lipoprotein with Yx(FWY)xxD motif
MSAGSGSRSPMTGARAVALVCGVALALSAFGLASGAVAATKPKAAVATVKIAGLGTVLVDAHGRTLYTLTNGGDAVPCTGTCAAAWPPLTLGAGHKLSVAKGGKGVELDADRQVTAHGLPLYRFAADTAAKQANGDGLASFGGTWHVVKVKVAKHAARKSSTTTRISGY